jgi:16S rRNA (cytidine1402-2'-O)-methyltransferase
LTRNNAQSGTLWVVATPLGNLDDLSPRAASVLAEADVVAAEDTRTSRKLVPPRAAGPEWVALHEHNESRVVARLLEALRAGRDVALVSDAGTPLISDPGFRLVAAAREAGLAVAPVPGPCAAVAALSVAGLPTDRFRFEGFPPAKAAARRQRLTELAGERATLVFYVPARDLPTVLADAAAAFGHDRRAVVARELTKQFETVRCDRLHALAEWVDDDPDQRRGEAVVVVAGCESSVGQTAVDAKRLAGDLAAELPPARAARILARNSGLSRRDAFALIESTRKNGCT